MVDLKKKKKEADMVVDSLDELFPKNEQDLEKYSVSTEEVKTQVDENPSSIGGNVGVKVVDDTGSEKQRVEYLRVPGDGSIEAVKLSDGSWAVTRRDKLPHNKEV